MKKSLLIVLTIFSFNTLASPATNAVDYRQAAFTLFKANLGEMGAMIKGKKPYNGKKFNKAAKNLKALSSMPWQYFAVDGSDMVDGTKAKDAVWDKPKEFKKGINYFKKLVSKLDKIAKAKATMEDVKLAFIEVAKMCKECHKKFKQKK